MECPSVPLQSTMRWPCLLIIQADRSQEYQPMTRRYRKIRSNETSFNPFESENMGD